MQLTAITGRCSQKIRRTTKKLLKIMKLTAILLLTACMQVAALSYSQTVSLTLKNKPMKQVFREIQKQTGLNVLVDESLLEKAGNVTLKLHNAPLEEALNLCLSNQPLRYTIEDGGILIQTRPVEILQPVISPVASIVVKGTVTDEKGVPLAGVTVKLKGSANIGTNADANGNFTLQLPDKGGVLIVSYVGYQTNEIPVSKEVELRIVLKQVEIKVDEVVVVGYGTQKKTTITGAISSVKAEQLTIAPVSNVTNALSGKLPGLITKQTSGLPGSDGADLSIRGFGNPLIIVDGIESSLNNIDANQIESISILKDGSASIYGARAGNGVILVTTKRGNNLKPTITFNSSMTNQGVTKMLKPASSGQRSEMEREAWIQSGNPEATAPWTIAQIQKFYDGTDPAFPNTNWYKELIRDWAPQQQHNLSVRGGSEKIKYYGFLSYMNQETMIKTNGGNFARYNMQSNIDAKITDDLTMQLDFAAISENNLSNTRGMGTGGNMWQDYWQTLPYYPAHLPDPTKVPYAYGAGTGGMQVTSNMAVSGYDKNITQSLRGTISLNYKIKAVKGLSAKAFVNYFKTYNTGKSFSRPVSLWKYEPTSMVYTQVGAYGTAASIGQSASNGNIFTQQYSLNYDNTFNKNHHITALALYESIDYANESISASRRDFLTPAIEQMFAGSVVGMSNNGYATEMGRKSYVGRLNYSYKDKYLLETIFRADASAKFPSAKRWGYFPSISLGWVMNKEGFMKQFSKLDNLKLRASYGQSGNDAVGNFQYLAGYRYGAPYILGAGPMQGLISTGLANPNLTWEKIKISNLGVDFSFFKRKLYGEIDAFYRQRSGIPTTRITSLPTTFGASLPPENLNSINGKGFEFNLGTAGKMGEVSYDVSGNISWSTSKWDHFEEPEYTDKDQKRLYQQSGQLIDRNVGYLSDGLFTSQSQIDQLKFDQDLQGNRTLRPGDVRYKDLNGDGKLDWKDQVDIGKGTIPHWMLGFNTNLKYKSFDLSAVFQGAFGYYTYVNLASTMAASTFYYDQRWTTTNKDPNAIIPRLGGAGTNGFFSDYYYKKSGYIRLKIASVGYSMPKQWLNKIGFSQVRIYAAGTNLLTFNKLSKFGIDPEAPNVGWYYPQQRTISFGVNASF
ncbi:MAG: SusC/RagA family TonB-linked outer membrane protein [Ferruginibacter sp.]|nr:SusC/RagA family TonB-linked outer membrane protein [Ferruginibacter sp.]